MLMAWLYQWRHHLGALTAIVAALYNFYNEANFDCSALLRAARLILACYCISTVTFGGWRFLWIVCRTLRRDVRGILVFVKMKLAIRKHVNNRENIPTLWNQTLQRFGDKTCFYFEDQKWSFRDVEAFSNRVAHFFLRQRWKNEGSEPVVALMMESRPEFVGFWLGLAKIDIPTALLNSKLRLNGIAHALEAVNAEYLIYDSDHTPFVDAARSLFPPGVKLLRFHPGPVNCGVSNPETMNHDDQPDNDFSARLAACSSQPVPFHSRAKSSFGDVLLYIFTSGTTGLPKAAIIRQQRYYVAHFAMSKAFKITPDDIVYCCLPLYHAAGNNLGVGLALMHGCSVVLTKKFSARAFWDDCRQYNVTIVQYIGEICRYLIAQPKRDTDSQHRVRLALGNGLRPQIWKEFQRRFAIQQIGEFYAATEGNANMLNTANQAGSIGFTSPLFRAFHPISFIKMDRDNEVELRDDAGLCIHCQPGDEGQLVGRIPDNDRLLQFDGYVNRKASSKKVLHSVWRKGDRAFASGDIMVMDELGYVYFRDRIGDTFRWKGENVSTAEVESVIMDALGFAEDVAVYGVAIPGTEGRAGMATIYLLANGKQERLHHRGDGDQYDVIRDDVNDNDLKTTTSSCLGNGYLTSNRKNAIGRENLDLDHLTKKLKDRLPTYAVPVFLRLSSSTAEATGTFKIKKAELKAEGFDLSKIHDDTRHGRNDQIYFMQPNSGSYVLMDRENLRLIHEGHLRF